MGDQPALQNVVEPPDPVYEENPELAQGNDQTGGLGGRRRGCDGHSHRLPANGQVILSDSVSTHYLPWADVYQYGPGTNITKLIKKIKELPDDSRSPDSQVSGI